VFRRPTGERAAPNLDSCRRPSCRRQASEPIVSLEPFNEDRLSGVGETTALAFGMLHPGLRADEQAPRLIVVAPV